MIITGTLYTVHTFYTPLISYGQLVIVFFYVIDTYTVVYL